MSPEPTRTAATRRQPRGELTRARIVEETARCVVELGFSAASTPAILERAGVTWGVVQYHFGGRQGLLTAVIDAGLAHLTAEVTAITDVETEVPPADRVRRVVESAWAAFDHPLSRASFEILVATRMARDPSVGPHFADVARQLDSLGEDLGVGRLLWTALRGIALVRMVAGDDVDVRADLEQVAVMLERQLG